MSDASVFYFAYGSNADPERFQARVGAWRSRRAARLPGHRLRFASSVRSEGGGGAVVDAAAGSTVDGVLYEIAAEQLAAMDREEFRGDRDTMQAGRRLRLTVTTDQGPIEAELYTVQDDGGWHPPSERYSSHIVHGLESVGHDALALARIRATAAIESADARRRLFVAMPLDDALAERVMLVRDELAPRIPPRSVRWVRRHQLHLTLRFLGDTLAIEVPQLIVRLGQACRGAASLRLGLRGVGVFPHVRQPRVVWAGLTGELDALVALQQRVAAACDPVAEQHEARAFRPHLTLGRVATHDRGEARAVGDAVASSAVGELGAWNVDRILLIHSRLRPEGPLHDTVAAMELSAAD